MAPSKKNQDHYAAAGEVVYICCHCQAPLKVHYSSIDEQKPQGEICYRCCSCSRPAEPGDLLVVVAERGDLVGVAQLLTDGADPNASAPARMPDGQVIRCTALTVAAQNGRLEAVRLLLEGGADPSCAGGDGCTPLMSAAANGELEVLRLLLARGAAVDAVEPSRGCTAFHFTCYNNHPECTDALARAGNDFRIVSKSGLTGMQMAEQAGSKEALRVLRALARQPFVGVLVQLTGLVGASEHNGKRAMVRPRARDRVVVCSLVACTLR
jgi:hypothetical protein